jgi:hypothetical protein
MKHLFLVLNLIIFSCMLTAQNVGINTTTPDNSAALDIVSTSKGMLIPRLTTTGVNNATGNCNVFLGYNAGANEMGSNKLYIANSNTTTPLVHGDFSTKTLTVNDYLTSKYLKMTNGAANGYILQSDANGNATWVATSVTQSIENQQERLCN